MSNTIGSRPPVPQPGMDVQPLQPKTGLDHNAIDTGKGLLSMAGAMPGKMGSAFQVFTSLTSSGMKMHDYSQRQENLLDAHHARNAEHYDQFGMSMDMEGLDRSYEKSRVDVEKAVVSGMKQEAYEVTKDLSPLASGKYGSVLTRLFTGFDAVVETSKVLDAYNKQAQSQGRLDNFQHDKAMIGKPQTSEDLQISAELRSENFDRRAEFGLQVAKSTYSVAKSLVAVMPRGPIAITALTIGEVLVQADWQKFGDFQNSAEGRREFHMLINE